MERDQPKHEVDKATSLSKLVLPVYLLWVPKELKDCVEVFVRMYFVTVIFHDGRIFILRNILYRLLRILDYLNQFGKL